MLDTNVFIRFLQGRLSARIRKHLTDGTELFVSVASFWEIVLKRRLAEEGVTLPLIETLTDQFGAMRLPVLTEHIRQLAALPLHHNDPFDRILICQALHSGLAIATSDREFGLYKSVQIIT